MEAKPINWSATILDIFEQLNEYCYSIANYGEIIKLLVKYQSVDLTDIRTENGNKVNILYYTIGVETNETKELLDLIKFILEKGVDSNYIDDEGWSLLHHACNCRLFKIAELLIKFGADINVKSSEGNTVLRLLQIDLERYSNPDIEKIKKFMIYIVNKGAIV